MGVFSTIKEFFSSSDSDGNKEFRSREGSNRDGNTEYRQDRWSGDQGDKGHRDHDWHKVDKDTGKSSEGSAGNNAPRSRDK